MAPFILTILNAQPVFVVVPVSESVLAFRWLMPVPFCFRHHLIGAHYELGLDGRKGLSGES